MLWTSAGLASWQVAAAPRQAAAMDYALFRMAQNEVNISLSFQSS